MRAMMLTDRQRSNANSGVLEDNNASARQFFFKTRKVLLQQFQLLGG